ncbi:MAG TPA: tRNA guanosine(34) transglycosylase Tgt [Acidobacteriota bacterium]|jgi:queuine tRNA-ribosyltransferase|nr:tRNA guanosine(34) transglycosylase Tgt [Acidobacteriota bacterium]HNR40026.1 tRNA guanosine(34) transglycosylase Tgt [Acidobacteriota bacterium]HNT99883.1 tRNA guanosine(34) transglycosylase Tgt [Acidobacteriota bacterium]HQO24149.1 tRNA guanosine(34) transglycosylase Tgt [Acidobacteriota bacterium]HQP72780.1 tRNA guanosine(34) transglycosylase Tgt [Acidobacteriota bacterium]
MSAFHYTVTHRDPRTAARRGRLVTPHAVVETPVFMPVGTAGTVKAVPHDWLEELDARILLANMYHLYLRPGHELVRALGGLHRFSGWPRALLTDSGGYQVFSHRELRRIDPEGVHFRSHIDGSSHFITPEDSIRVQQALGADIIMAFDDCTPYPATREEARASMETTLQWARRSRAAHPAEDTQLLFGIVQGSVYPDLRAECADRLTEIGFQGYAIGGLSVGEPKDTMYAVTGATAALLPEDRPRYLMGVGTPEDLLEAVAMGVDMFDCVLPTRNGRNGCLFTRDGRIVIKNARHARDDRPPDPECGCRVCRRYSRAYLRHLFMSSEMLSATLNTFHNLYFYLDIMEQIRQSIELGAFADFKQNFLARYHSATE